MSLKPSDAIVKKFNEYYVFCKIKYQAHLKAAEKYDALYIYTGTPIIILTTLTTILASYNVVQVGQGLAIAAAIVSCITTVSQALASFLEFKVKYTSHLNVSNKYILLARFIETEFYLPYNSSNPDDLSDEVVKTLFTKITTDLINIQDGEPCLPSDISEKNYAQTSFGVGTISDVLINLVSTRDEINQISQPAQFAQTPIIQNRQYTQNLDQTSNRSSYVQMQPLQFRSPLDLDTLPRTTSLNVQQPILSSTNKLPPDESVTLSRTPHVKPYKIVTIDPNVSIYREIVNNDAEQKKAESIEGSIDESIDTDTHSTSELVPMV